MTTARLVRRSRRRVPDYTWLGCPLTKSNALWCHGLCVPEEGIGVCGRVAPHSVTGRTQMAILNHKVRQEREKRAAS